MPDGLLTVGELRRVMDIVKDLPQTSDGTIFTKVHEIVNGFLRENPPYDRLSKPKHDIPDILQNPKPFAFNEHPFGLNWYDGGVEVPDKQEWTELAVDGVDALKAELQKKLDAGELPSCQTHSTLDVDQCENTFTLDKWDSFDIDELEQHTFVCIKSSSGQDIHYIKPDSRQWSTKDIVRMITARAQHGEHKKLYEKSIQPWKDEFEKRSTTGSTDERPMGDPGASN